jgi:hypothetical protein
MTGPFPVDDDPRVGCGRRAGIPVVVGAAAGTGPGAVR